MSQKADKESDLCQLMFADPEDCGKIFLEDIYIYTVFNGIDLFLGGTENRIPSFRNGIDEIFHKLMKVTSVASTLQLCTDDKTVQLTLSQAVDVMKSVGHNLNKMFIPIEDEDDDDEIPLNPTRKRRTSKEPGEIRTKYSPQFTSLCLWRIIQQ